MKILVANDDGIEAPGLAALELAVCDYGDITVVAPSMNRSGISSALTLHDPIPIERLSSKRIKVYGTPTDCVHLALTGMLEERFDMVVSGINLGANLGDDVWYSGTVAAALEGRFLGLPSIAFSLAGDDPRYLNTAVKVVHKILPHVLSHPLPSGVILSVNIPAIPYEKVRGIEIARLGARHCAEPAIREVDEQGKEIYWIGAVGAGADAGPGTDFYAISQNKVVITALSTDVTDYAMCHHLKQWVGELR